MTAEVYRAAGKLLAKEGKLAGVADEGGYWPAFDTNEEALGLAVAAIEAAGFTPGDGMAISLDIAASDFGKGGRYRLAREGRELDTDGMIAMLLGWLDRYPIRWIEDPLAEDDEAGLIAFTRPRRASAVVGDDYLVTNAARVRHAAEVGACNTALIKPNQAGTLTETKAAFAAARAARLAEHRLRPVGRDRGRVGDAPCRRLGRGDAEGRLLHPLRAHGQVERGAADRRGARRPAACPARRADRGTAC